MNPTTTQLRTFAQGNPYIRQYLNTDKSEKANAMYRKFGRMPYVKIDHGGSRPCEYDLATYQSNERYHYAWSEFRKKWGKIETQQFFHVEVEGVNFRLVVRFDIDGECTIYIDSASIKTANGTASAYKLPWIDEYRSSIKYTGRIEEEPIKKAATAEIEKHLFAPGFFRNIQIEKLCTKERAKELYKYWIQNRDTSAYDEGEVTAWIKRHMNIDISEFWNFERAVNWVKKAGKQSRPVVLREAPSALDILDGFDGDVDEIEDLLNDYMDEYPKNAIFI